MKLAFWKKDPAPIAEVRSNLENPAVPISQLDWSHLLNWLSAAGVEVNITNAMGVPGFFCAVHFLSGTIAGLPLHLYEKSGDGRKSRVTGGLATILHDAVNDETSSFDWRKYAMERVLTSGRSVTFIERNTAGRIINLWPLIPKLVTVKRKSGRKVYVYKEPNREPVTYAANEVIDITFGVDEDQVTAVSPVMSNKDTAGLAIAATLYGSKFFQNGGVPPFVMTGNFQTGAGLTRASNDLQDAVTKAAKENRLALTLPAGHDIKNLGVDPQKSQMVELKRFLIEEIARIYQLPPVFLQDLSRGTFSNTEQQDLHLVKHTIRRWVEQIEQELNLKLFGRLNAKFFVKFNVDGLLRGDFKTRMDGYAVGIQNAVLKPNEARALENRENDPQGDVLMIQGATVPLGSQPKPNEQESSNGNEV